jgi:hypothetical protein
MKPFTRVLSAFAVGILLQGGVYLYLDQYMFAPTTEFNVSGASKDDTKNFPDVKEGRKYVSYDHQFMAVVTDESLRIYKAGESKPTTVSLKGRSISYFDWMPDRNYAIMARFTLLNGPNNTTNGDVTAVNKNTIMMNFTQFFLNNVYLLINHCNVQC